MQEVRVYSVAVASADEKFYLSLKKALPASVFSPVEYLKSGGELLRRARERSFDIVIINTPLPDDFGTKTAVELYEVQDCVSAVLIRDDAYSDLASRMRKNGVFVLKKPTDLPSVVHLTEHLCAARERLRSVRKNAVSVEQKMAEIRLINRAKAILIERERMTEAEAHAYIVKRAMDECLPKAQIAENIIKTASV